MHYKKPTEADIKNMQELVALGMRLNRDNFHVKVEFVGHVSSFNCYYTHGGDIGKPTYPQGHVCSFDKIPEAMALLQRASDNNEDEIARVKQEANRYEYERLKKIFGGEAA